jgi:uracil-DNA glycosylase family 4
VQATVAIVGQNPVEQEDRRKQAFVGPAADKVNRWLVALGLKPQQVYWTHAVKCHTRKNRKLKAAELKQCTTQWLARELALLPALRAVITLGRPTKDAVLGTNKTMAGIPLADASRAVIADANGRELHVFPIQHPDSFLRSPEDEKYLLSTVLPEVRRALVEVGAVHDANA